MIANCFVFIFIFKRQRRERRSGGARADVASIQIDRRPACRRRLLFRLRATKDLSDAISPDGVAIVKKANRHSKINSAPPLLSAPIYSTIN